MRDSTVAGMAVRSGSAEPHCHSNANALGKWEAYGGPNGRKGHQKHFNTNWGCVAIQI